MKKQLTTTIAIFSYFVLYAPQPLLPMFAHDYAISISQAGALMTATLIPLAFAPLLYGYLLSAISPSTLLRYAIIGMGLSCLAFTHSDSYPFAFVVRFAQGLLLPATLTAITTYIGTHSLRDELQKNMSLFITGTILGGLFGRILAGVFATYLSWQSFYYGLAIILLFIGFLVPKMATTADNKRRYAQPKLAVLPKVFATAGIAKLYISIFGLFFSFVALLNYLPFMLKSLLNNPSELLLGLMYCGFIMGAVASLNAQRLIVRLKSSKRVMCLGFATFLLAIGLLFIQHVAVIFIVLFLFCGSMFLVHSVASAEINKRSQDNKSIFNALYVTFYYSGGVAGSYFPGLLYQHYGNTAFLSCLLVVSTIGFLALLTLSPER